MTDSRRGGSAIEPKSAELMTGGRNHLETASATQGDAPTLDGRFEHPTASPAAWVGSGSESRLRVPASDGARSDGLAGRKTEPGDIMTRAEVAALLRCSEPHVVALVEREQLPGFRLGRPWRFRRAEVLAWCERRVNGRRSA
jgi:excisionase family DNA binding protein